MLNQLTVTEYKVQPCNYTASHPLDLESLWKYLTEIMILLFSQLRLVALAAKGKECLAPIIKAC
jgi:hypothetical protein